LDNNKRYELLVKLSDFYVKEVKNKLDVYNEARKISYIAVCCSRICILFIALLFLCCIIGTKSIIPYLSVLVALSVILFVIIFPALQKRDKANNIHVFKYEDKNTVTLPQSADNAIKKYLMPKFMDIFENLKWNQYSTTEQTPLFDNPEVYKKGSYSYADVQKMIKSTSNYKDKKYLGSLNILDSIRANFLEFDDCIWGSYQNVNIRILEAASINFLNLAVLLFVMFGLGIFVIPIFILVFSICAAFFPIIGILIFLSVPLIIVSLVLRYIFINIYNKSFRGIFVEIDMNKNFEGHTFVLEKDDYRNKAAAIIQGYEPVKLEDVEFEKQYAVYSQNQIEARYILTTAFMERIKAIKETYKAKYVRVAFKDRKIVVAIHTGRDMFKMAGAKDMTKETFLQLFNEIASVLDLVETLKLNEKTGL